MPENEFLAVYLYIILKKIRKISIIWSTKITILQKFEALIDLDSLKMTPFADFWG